MSPLEKQILTDYASGKISKEKAMLMAGLKKATFNSRMRDLGFSSKSHYFPSKSFKPLIPKNDAQFWSSVHARYIMGESLVEIADSLGIRASTVKERFDHFQFPLRSESENRKQAVRKMREGTLKKFGVEYPQQSDTIQKKTKATVQSKYGVDNIAKVDSVRQTISSQVKASAQDALVKRKTTNTSVYGVPFANQHPSIKDKIKATNIQKYGNPSAASSPTVRAKIESTNLNRFGVKSPLEIPEVFNARFTDEFKDARISTIREKQTQRILTKLSFHGYELLEPYTQLHDGSGWIRYKIKHLPCGLIFEDDLFALPRCLECFHKHKRSFAENAYFEFIKSLEPTAQAGVSIDGVNVDIWIPEKKIAFEYNGLYWHSVHNRPPKGRRSSQYHWKKTQEVAKSGGALIHIWEHNDPEIVKSRISQVLGKSTQTIYARKLHLRSVGISEANDFFCLNHLDGSTPNQIKAYGLFNDEEMVCCLTVKNRNQYIEIARFASKLHTSVVAGFSKLLAQVKKDFHDRIILTYANTDWTPNPENSVYSKTGFHIDGHTGPSLMFTDFKQVFSREAFQKHKLKEQFPQVWDENLSATVILSAVGIYPLYDSGNWRFILKPSK